jgi:hypothetical protein
MDETSYAMGDIERQRCFTYVGAEDTRATRGEGLQITQARGKWITSIECVSASGVTLAPYVIYKGSGPNQAWVVRMSHLSRMIGHLQHPSQAGQTTRLATHGLSSTLTPSLAAPKILIAACLLSKAMVAM